MSIKLFNYTPHPITLIKGENTLIIPSSGIARVEEECSKLGSIRFETISGAFVIPCIRKEFKPTIIGLPEEKEGIFYIVSALVKSASNRQDLVSIGELMRDSAGNVIGALSLNVPSSLY